MKYGYARVSTEDQNPAMQLAALKKAGCKAVFKDEVTGAHVKRPALTRCLKTLQAGDTLIFPDFALRHRGDGRRWLVEIVGFWTRDYVDRKLALLRVAGLRDLVLCIDESRNCADAALPSSSRIVLFRRRLDATAVLRVIGQEAAG